jgi:hypothetical protein
VSIREREGLIARIRQIRSVAKSQEEQSPSVSPRKPDEASALEVRVAHLEQLLQGLQDSVHRDSIRHTKRISELEARLEPSALSKALSEDARERGL